MLLNSRHWQPKLEQYHPQSTALKKAYDDHCKELEAMQEAMQDKFNKQLQLIQQQNITSTSEKKFDSLLELLLKDTTTIQRESPVWKKGKPTNLDETFLSQLETPPHSNTKNNGQLKTPEQNMQIDEDPPLGAQNDTNNIDGHTTDSGSSDGYWITKGKKDKKPHQMTQTKLVDLMQNGGYGIAAKGNPYNRNQRGSPLRQGRGTPPRAKGTHQS
jgi:hypothetical protein